jgi:hypothetical protein
MNWAVIKDPTILMTATVYGLLASIAISARLFGIWLGILLFISLWRYAYFVMLAFAQGHKRIPPPAIESMNPIGQWGLFFHLVAFPGLVIATAPYQPTGTVIALLVAVTFPASAALMGLTSNLAYAFNPQALVDFARTLGSDYYSLVFGYCAILFGAFVIVSYLVPVFGFLSLLPGLIIEFWALLASFALIGSVLRKHRLRFEIAGELVPREEQMLLRRHQEWTKDLDIAYTAFRSGLYASGYKTLHALVDSAGDSLDVNHWLVENMLDWQDKQYGIEVAAKLLGRLLALGDSAGALELYRRCRRHVPEFRPPPAEAQELAAFAAAVGQAGLANELSYNQASGADR